MTVLAPLLALLLPLLGGSPPDPVPRGQGVWPLDPRPAVVRGFDPPDSPWGSGHRGVDLLGRPGQPVRASLAGRITFAGSLAGRGVVVVDHGAVRTTYEPVAAGVRVGSTVARGGAVGTLQAVQSHCAPRACLHWGLLRGAQYLDPLVLVGGGPVRLLPLTGTAPLGLAPTLGRRLPAAAASGAVSGARVGELVGRAQPVGGHVRVELGGRQ